VVRIPLVYFFVCQCDHDHCAPAFSQVNLLPTYSSDGVKCELVNIADDLISQLQIEENNYPGRKKKLWWKRHVLNCFIFSDYDVYMMFENKKSDRIINMSAMFTNSHFTPSLLLNAGAQ
jgi:hypothetical protein